MNENLNLIKILKNVPKGTKLWSPLFGEVEFEKINWDSIPYPIYVTKEDGDTDSFTKDGRIFEDYQGECMLFPSKVQHDWSQFEAPKGKVKVTLHPFECVLTRDCITDSWMCSIFSHYLDDRKRYRCTNYAWRWCIPYNEQTAHLLGTKDPCPIDYDIECSKVPAPTVVNLRNGNG